jgi:hypothetical protein
MIEKLQTLTLADVLIDSSIVLGMCIYGYYFGELYLFILKNI